MSSARWSASAIPLNEGCLRPLTIIVPEGTPAEPARPGGGDRRAIPRSASPPATRFTARLGVVAAAQGTMNNFIWGNDAFQNYETIAGGTGAGPGFAGCDAVQSHMTNTRMTDPEVLEKRFPVRLEEFSIRQGSGGAGQWRGGDGAVRRLRFLDAGDGDDAVRQPQGGALRRGEAAGRGRWAKTVVHWPDGRAERLAGQRRARPARRRGVRDAHAGRRRLGLIRRHSGRGAEIVGFPRCGGVMHCRYTGE